jgi:hypothetical protein
LSVFEVFVSYLPKAVFFKNNVKAKAFGAYGIEIQFIYVRLPAKLLFFMQHIVLQDEGII